MRCAAMIRPIVLAILACALTTHDAAGQSVTGFSPSSGVIQVPATGPGAQVITIHNADTVDALFVDLPALSWFEWAEVSTVVGYCDTDFTLPSSGPVRVTVDLGSTCILSVAVLAAPPPGQSVEEIVTLYAAGSAYLSASYTLRATASGGGGGPVNDHFADAENLSGLAIPPFVAVPHPEFAGLVVPRDTVSVAGTTVGSTREPFEYGTVVNEDGSETAPPNGTVWFRYTSPPGGFAGRLGYRVTRGFFAAPVVQRPGATEPMPDLRSTDFAPGNTWPPSNLSFVRMEPGHTVWFQVQTDVVTPPGDFTLELYQAPNEQDSILNAYSITGADRPDGTGAPWSDGLQWFGDGDTYHLTADQPGGPPNMWFTANFDGPGLWSFRALSEQANRNGITRPFGVRLYRAPTGQRVNDPGVLDFVQGTDGSEICCVNGFGLSPFPPEPVWSSALIDVPVEPGRYYWSVDEGADGPTFYSLSASYRATGSPDTTPPTITITGIQEAATVTIASPTVTITSDEPLTVVDCTLDIVRDDGPTSSNPVGCLAVPPVTSGQFTFPELPDGNVTLTVFGRDAAGNSTTVTRSFSVQVDPVVSIAAPANGATYQQGQVPALAYTCSDNSGVIASQTPSLGVNGDPWPGAPPSTPGTWRINVDCVDGSGNGGTASVTYTVVADTTPPDTQLVGEGTTVGFRDDGSAGSVPSFTFSGSDAEPGPVTFECRVTTFRTIVTFPSVLPDPPAPPDPQPSWAACTSPFTLSGLVEGAYTFSVRAVDAAGNQDATPPSLTFTVDRTAPLVAFAPVGVVLANGATVTADQVPTQLDRGCADVLISGYRFEASDRGLEADTTLAAPVHAVVGGWTLPRTLGTHSTTVSCTNTSGLTTTATFTYTVAEPPPPPPPCASDLSGILSVTKGPIRYVWVRQRFEQAVTLTNTTNAAIPAPLDVALALDGLGTHVTMVNASGVTACAAPAGSPYIVVPTQPGRQWGPSERVTLTLAFTTTQNLAITFTTRVLGGTSR